MRKLSLLLFIVLSAAFTFAQKGSNSPFSSYGIGEIGGLDNATFIGIGNSTATLMDSVTLNFYNPASYHYLAQHQPLFSLGISSKFSKYSENGISSTGNVTSIQHFAIAFPFANRFGLAFGLKPFSSVGYEFNNRVKVGTDSLNYVYEGNGGLNEAFAGLSVKAIDYKGAKLSVGANFGYVFGQIINTKKSGLIKSGTSVYAGGIRQKTYQSKAFHYSLGIDYTQRINEKHTVGISAILDPQQNISSKFEDVIFYSASINDVRFYDTLSVNDSLKGNLTTIPTSTLGVKYIFNYKGRKNSNNPLNSQLQVHFNYSTADWSKYQNTFDPTYVNTFKKSTKMTFGIQFLPETNYVRNKEMTKFYQRIRYRAGIYQIKMPYVTNGEQVSDFGTTFGFGIPIIIKRSLSSINFGFSLGNRGTSDSNALKERYYGFNIGLSIAPGNDRWFIKRKLN